MSGSDANITFGVPYVYLVYGMALLPAAPADEWRRPITSASKDPACHISITMNPDFNPDFCLGWLNTRLWSPCASIHFLLEATKQSFQFLQNQHQWKSRHCLLSKTHFMQQSRLGLHSETRFSRSPGVQNYSVCPNQLQCMRFTQQDIITQSWTLATHR